MTDEEKVRKINPYWQVAILNATITDLEKENEELKKQGKIREEIIIGEQQEIEELKKEFIQTEKEYAVLKIKYAELKEYREELVKDIKALQVQIDQLSNDNYVLKTSFITQQEQIEEQKAQNKDLCESLDIMNNRESELLEQIKKMKCCGNCKHWKNEGLQKYCILTSPNFLIKKQIDKCDKWELSE